MARDRRHTPQMLKPAQGGEEGNRRLSPRVRVTGGRYGIRAIARNRAWTVTRVSHGLEYFIIEMLSESSGARLISALLIRKALRANGTAPTQ